MREAHSVLDVAGARGSSGGVIIASRAGGGDAGSHHDADRVVQHQRDERVELRPAAV